MSGLSSIELSRFSKTGVAIEGSLKAVDISGLNLNAQLVVLSACETSLGQLVRGEGYLGLTRAFLEAGTENVVSTLWKVEDKTTAELMKLFYQGLMQGLTVPNALKKAQNTIRLSKGKADPYYWAGFCQSWQHEFKVQYKRLTQTNQVKKVTACKIGFNIQLNFINKY